MGRYKTRTGSTRSADFIGMATVVYASLLNSCHSYLNQLPVLIRSEFFPCLKKMRGLQRYYFITTRKNTSFEGSSVGFMRGGVMQFTREVRFPLPCCQFFLPSSKERKP